ncbi:hypothetical protein BJ165DRAFT_1526244 [Panaeolus papilionaceus]|nr:hypothetical protein BJ165DRAFT_1526244 [Panaeolus papilionaceus]
MSTFPQSPAKRPFSLVTLLCALFILLLGLVIQFPHYRRLSSCLRRFLFVPYAWCLVWTILNTTTGDPQADVGAGGALATLLLVGFDFLIATDAQRELYPVDDTGKRIGQPISEVPLQTRIKWAFQLIGNLRGVGWNFEPRFLLEERSKIGKKEVSRGSFVRRQLIRLIFLAFLDQFGTQLGFINPVFSSTYLLSPQTTHSGFVRALWRCLGLATFAVTSYARIGGLHCAMSLVAVSLFNSRIQDWPPLFGSIKDAWTVQHFWG